MKIKFTAYLYVLATFWCTIVASFILADSNSIILLNQFRTPYSLTEMLHDGFVFVQNSLDQIVTTSKENSLQLLQMIADKLEELENIYTQMYAKSVFHEIRNDEVDFLENLINKIDQMIHQLESDTSYSEHDQELVTKNLNLLQNLKQQIIS